MAEKIRIILRSPTAEGLRNLLKAGALDLNCGGPQRAQDGSFQVEAFVTRKTLGSLRKLGGGEIAVDEGFGKRMQARRSEVGSGNRYKDGRIPRGPGRKK